MSSPNPIAIGIKTIGQIETLSSQKVEVTTPIEKAKVVELLVEPCTIAFCLCLTKIFAGGLL